MTNQDIWKKLMLLTESKILTAALMAHFKAESGLRPNNLQNSFERKIGVSDVQYTENVDNGSYSRDAFIHDSAGYGLAQWTYWSRKEALYDWVKKKGYSIGDLDGQIAFCIAELQVRYPSIWTSRNTITLYEMVSKLHKEYERPADQSAAAIQKRYTYAEEFMKEFGSDSNEVDKKLILDVICEIRKSLDILEGYIGGMDK